jgi:hypothetical protein
MWLCALSKSVLQRGILSKLQDPYIITRQKEKTLRRFAEVKIVLDFHP